MLKHIFRLLLILTYFLTSCTREKVVNVIPYKLPTKVESGTIIYGEKTIVVNDQTSKSLTKITDSSLEFSTGSVADNITAGQILMSGITQEAPQGYLRKVTAVQKNGSNIVIQTTNATFEEAIKECHLKYTKILSKSARIGVTQEAFELPYKMEWDRDGNKNTTYDKVTLDAKLKIDPDFKFEMDIESFTLKNLVSSLKISNVGDLTVEIGGSIGKLSDVLKNADGYLIGEIDLPPFVVPGTPITFFNKVKFLIGIEGEVSAKLTLHPILTGSVEGGVKYTDTKGIQYISEVENKLEMETPLLEGKATLESWFQVRLQSSPFDFKNVKVFIAGRVSAKAEATINQFAIDAGIKIGVKSNVNAQMQVFGRALIQPIDYTLIEKYYDTPYRWQFLTPLIEIKTNLTDRILGNQAILNRTIKYLGVGITLQEVGVCWSKTNTSPTIKAFSGVEKSFPTTLGSNMPAKYYSSDGNILEDAYLNNLTPNTTYYARNYARVTDTLVLYGNVVSFTTCKLSTPAGRFNKIVTLDANTLTFNVDVSTGCQVAVWYKVYELKNNKWEVFITGTGQLQTYSNPNNQPTPFNKDIFVGGLRDANVDRYVKGKKYALKVIFANEVGSSETDYIPFER